MKIYSFYLFMLLLCLSIMDGYASGTSKHTSHSSSGHTYTLGVHASGTTDHHSDNGHPTGYINHANRNSRSSYVNPKSTYHSSIVGNSTYFRANKNPPKHSEEDDRYSSDKKAKADKEAKTPEAPAKVQHAIDPFKPKPRPKPGTYSPAAPIFLSH